MTHGRTLTLGMPITLLATLAVALPAGAELPINPCYQDAHVHPRQGSAPANAPALVFAPGQRAQDASVAAYQVELRAPDDTVVPYTMVPDPSGSEYLLVADRALTSGNYRLRYRQLCSWGSPTVYDQTVISLAADSPLPTVIGRAQLQSPVAKLSGSASCMPVDAFAVVDVTMSPEFAAYHELARYRVSYRQQPLRIDGYFQNDPPGVLDYGNIQHTETTLHIGIHDTCALGQTRVQGQIEIAAHVAGAASDPAPLRFDVDVECPFFKEGPPPPCLNLDAGSGPLAPDADISPDGRGLEIDVGAPPLTADAARPRDLAAGAAEDGPALHRDLGLTVSHDAWAGDLPSKSATDAGAGPVTGGEHAGCSCTVAGGRRPVGKLVWWVGLPLLGVLRWRRSSSRR